MVLPRPRPPRLLLHRCTLRNRRPVRKEDYRPPIGENGKRLHGVSSLLGLCPDVIDLLSDLVGLCLVAAAFVIRDLSLELGDLLLILPVNGRRGAADGGGCRVEGGLEECNGAYVKRIAPSNMFANVNVRSTSFSGFSIDRRRR